MDFEFALGQTVILDDRTKAVINTRTFVEDERGEVISYWLTTESGNKYSSVHPGRIKKYSPSVVVGEKVDPSVEFGTLYNLPIATVLYVSEADAYLFKTRTNKFLFNYAGEDMASTYNPTYKLVEDVHVLIADETWTVKAVFIPEG